MTQVPHVAVVTPYFPPHLGGVEVVADRLARELGAQGVDVEVLTTDVRSGGRPRRERRGAVRVRRYRALEVAHTAVSPGLFLGLLRQPRGTVVHVHVAHAMIVDLVRWASAIRGFAYVAHLHLDVDASGPVGRALPAYKRWLLGPALRRAAAVIALTPQMREFLMRTYGLERVEVVPNAVDAEFFALSETDPDRAPESGALRVLFVGRLSAQKNVPRLLGAVARLREPVEVVLVGDGDARPALERSARELGLDNVRFAGPADTDGVVAWMRWADVVAMSSDKEGLPLVALEAMAAGVPVVATDVDGLRELVGDVGLLVPATEAGLAEGLERLAREPALRQELAERGRTRAASCSWDAVALDLRDVLVEAGGVA